VSAAIGLPFRLVPGGIELAVRVTPRGGRDAVDGIGVDAAGRAYWQVRVRVAPEDGAANRAVLALVAKALDVPAREIGLVAGETARLKRLLIRGSSEDLARKAAAIRA
jgi:uncharacterized protein YggU (UPF0235/DUF167 family)